MKPVRIKICGITSVDDALAAATAGADAIGLVFYKPSPRSVDLETAATIRKALPPFVTVVGLFVDASVKTVNQTLDSVPIDILQFHGDETAEFCDSFSKPWLKAIRVKSASYLAEQIQSYSQASGLLFDTYVEGVAGGTGESFDWSLLPEKIDKPWVLAGGLDATNVSDALNRCKPWAVDVSGGVEIPGQKGRKDHARIESFINQVKSFHAR